MNDKTKLKSLFESRKLNAKKRIKEELDNSASTTTATVPAGPAVPQVSPVAAAAPAVDDKNNIPEIIGKLVSNPWDKLPVTEGDEGSIDNAMTKGDLLKIVAESEDPMAKAFMEEIEAAATSPEMKALVKEMEVLKDPIPSPVTEQKKFSLYKKNYK